MILKWFSIKWKQLLQETNYIAVIINTSQQVADIHSLSEKQKQAVFFLAMETEAHSQYTCNINASPSIA